MSRLTALSVFFICLSACWGAATQGNQGWAVYPKIVSVIEGKEPNWKIGRRDPRPEVLKPKHFPRWITLEWKKGQDKVYLTIYEAESNRMAYQSLRLHFIPPKETDREVLLGFGDPAYLWSPRLGRSTLVCVNGKTVIKVTAPSPDIAKRFARHALGLL